MNDLPDPSHSTQDYAKAALAERTRLSTDPHRPRYHFVSPANWLNDPNGLIQWRGMYHMFYQHNPNGTFSATKHWGHAVSPDLIHWTDLPLALAPTPGTADQDGCFSGCIVVDEGVPTIIYTGVRNRSQRPCIAVGSDDLITWTSHPGNPVVEMPPADLDIVGFRDHAVWREDDMWYQLVGSGIRGRGGTALLYCSRDLRLWEYIHPLFIGDQQRHMPLWTGIMWECPDFFALENQHVLIVSIFDNKQEVRFAHLPMIHHAVYFVGTYANHHFTPTHEAQVDYGYSLYAPQSFTDELGRRILFGWLREERASEVQVAAGWSGAMSLPRVLSLSSNGGLTIEPAPQVEILRKQQQHWENCQIPVGTAVALDGLQGDTIEIVVELTLGAAVEVGLSVRCAPDNSEETRIIYNRAAGELIIDRTRSSLNPATRRDRCIAPLQVVDGEALRLHVFVDRSIIEVFAKPDICIASRVYPTQTGSVGVKLFALGAEAKVVVLDVWEMASIWP